LFPQISQLYSNQNSDPEQANKYIWSRFNSWKIVLCY